MAFVGLFAVSTMRLGHSVETLTGPGGAVVATHVYGLSAWSRVAGVIGLLGCAFLGVAAFAAVAGRPPLARVTLLLGVGAALLAGPVVILATLFALVAMATARGRQRVA
jgi:hypothetical protein